MALLTSGWLQGQVAKYSALVCWPILPILLHLAHALYMPEGEFFLTRFYLGSPTDKYVSFGRAAM